MPPRTPKKSSKARQPKRSFRVVPLKANIVEQLPETSVSRRGLTLRQLLRNTPRFRKETGKYEVVLKKVKKQKTKTGLPAISAEATHPEAYMPGKTLKKRNVYIVGLESQTKPINKQRRVMVSCSCEDFVLHGGEYACAVHGAAKIIYGNGQPPVYTNPGNLPFLCLAGDTLVSTEKGLMEIKDIRAGIKVNTLQGLQSVTHQEMVGTKDIFRFHLDSGTYLDATYDHKVLCVNDRGRHWKAIGDLSLDDYVIKPLYADANSVLQDVTSFVPTRQFSPCAKLPASWPTVLDENLASVLGYVVSDGTRSNFTSEDLIISKYFKTVFRKCFGNDPTGRFSMNISKPIGDFLVALGLESKSDKHRIPKLIFASPASVQIAFLSALYDGDGYITNKVSTYGTSSELLAQDLIHLLGTLGIYTRLNVQQESGVNGIPIYLVRTSSFKETQKLVKLLDSFKGEPSDYQPSKGSTLSDDLRINMRSLIHNYAESYVDSLLAVYADISLLVPVRDLVAQFCGTVDEAVKHIDCAKVANPDPRYKALNACTTYQFLTQFKQTFIRKVIRQILSPGVLLSSKFIFGIKTKSKLRRCLDKNLLSLEEHPVLEKTLQFLSNPVYVFESIENHEYLGKEKVYDISVDQASHFFANGIVTHNCKHLSALAYELIEKNL